MRGFTLIEVMFSLAIVAVLATLAAPSFRSITLNNRLAGASNEFMAALNMTRSEAVKRGSPVTLCRSATAEAVAPTCLGAGGWEAGWVLFTDPDNDGTIDAGETVISVRGNLGNGLLLQNTGGGLLDTRLTFAPTGTPVAANNGTLRLCHPDYTEARNIVISATGRPRVVKTSGGTCP